MINQINKSEKIMSSIEQLNIILENNPNYVYRRDYDRYIIGELPKQDKILDFVIAMSQTPKNKDGAYLQSKRVKKSVKKLDIVPKHYVSIEYADMVLNGWDEPELKLEDLYNDDDMNEALERIYDTQDNWIEEMREEMEEEQIIMDSFFAHLFIYYKFEEFDMNHWGRNFGMEEDLRCLWAKGNDYN